MEAITSQPQNQLPGLSDAMFYVFLLMLALYFVPNALGRLSRRKRLPPGPKGWPIIGCLHLLGPMPHVSLFELAKKYGPIMYLRLGAHGMVIASSPEAARAFLKTHDANFSNRPPNSGATHMAYARQDLVWADYGPRYKLLKKITSLHLLGGKAIEDSVGIRKDEMGHLVRDISAMYKRGEAVPVADMLSCAMANMLGMAVLSRRVFSEVGGSAAEFKEMVVELMTLAGQFNVGDFLPWIDWMDVQGILGKMKRVMKRFDFLVDRLVKEHEGSKGERSGNNNRKDLLDAAMEYCDKTSEDGITINMTNIKGLVLDLFAAGTDTSSSIIEWAIAELLANPKILKRAHEEMDIVIGKDRRLEESDIPNLPYFRAICKETFRKHPSTPLNLPLMAAESCEVEGYHIPKGTRLMVNIWGMGRDHNNWPNPLEFNPDRFMSPDMVKIDPRGNNFELIPFGAGRRICAGARMGFVFVEYILGSLIHAFNWEMSEGEEMDMGEEFGIALQKAVPVKATAVPRLAPHIYTN